MKITKEQLQEEIILIRSKLKTREKNKSIGGIQEIRLNKDILKQLKAEEEHLIKCLPKKINRNEYWATNELIKKNREKQEYFLYGIKEGLK